MSSKQKVLITLIIIVLVLGIASFWISWSSTKQELALAVTELTGTQAALESKENELAATKDELFAAENELESTEDQLFSVEGELQLTRVQLADAETELQITKDYLLNIEAELQATQTRLSALQTDALHLHNPNYEEVIRFLSEDKTDANQYVESAYICAHFAREVNNNAESRGIRCAYVDLRYPTLAHAIVAFDTIDEGMVYFDPQTDERVRPVIGREYWRCIEPQAGYYYIAPGYDDTIEDIIVVW